MCVLGHIETDVLINAIYDSDICPEVAFISHSSAHEVIV